MGNDVVDRLRKHAEGTANASKLIADAKSSRNQAAEGGPWPGYESLRKEQTDEWEAADEIVALRAIIRSLAPEGSPGEVEVRKATSFRCAENIYLAGRTDQQSVETKS